MNGATQWFWSIIVLACLVWYSTMVLFVTYRGAVDIRGMLARLKQGQLDGAEGSRPSKQ
ncbi:MAG: hypothetical protein IT364_21260 [Candidatus Hydrogenedentes bacterium]|nr:hypothetical protein [Candidatus Hydrogenedentota bacterium]